MDKAKDSPGPNDPSWPEDSGAEQGFGVTGVFKAVAPSDAETDAATVKGSGTGAQGSRPADPFNPPTFVGSKPPAEPIVHKVVLGGGAETSPELLDRIRMASQEKALPVEKPVSASPAGAGGGGGFTQLLRTLEVELPTASTAPKNAPPLEPRPAAQDSGFTSLLSTLGSQEPAASSPPQATRIVGSRLPWLPRRTQLQRRPQPRLQVQLPVQVDLRSCCALLPAATRWARARGRRAQQQFRQPRTPSQEPLRNCSADWARPPKRQLRRLSRRTNRERSRNYSADWAGVTKRHRRRRP